MKRLLLSTSRAVTCIDSWLLLQKLVLLWDCFLLFCSWRRKFREIAFLLTEQFLIYSRNLFTNNCHLANLASCVVDKDLTGAVEVKTLKETLTHHHTKSHEFRRGRSCSEEKCVLVSIDKLRSSECRQFSQRIWQVHLAFFPQESNKIQRKFSSASPKRWVLIIPSLFCNWCHIFYWNKKMKASITKTCLPLVGKTFYCFLTTCLTLSSKDLERHLSIIISTCWINKWLTRRATTLFPTSPLPIVNQITLEPYFFLFGNDGLI